MATPQKFRAACVQFCATRNVEQNLAEVVTLIRQAADEGAQFISTPENTGIMELSHANIIASLPAQARALKQFQALAVERGVWLHIGSLGVAAGGRIANRSFLINSDGDITTTYDKIHMFDVDLPGAESYHESKNYAPGEHAVLADLPWGKAGFSICYDLRFPTLYRKLAHAGAGILLVPAAFTRQTGRAHWHILLRARAIENTCFVIAAGQCGDHDMGRATYGHSLIIAPWGEILAEAGEKPGIIIAEIEPARIAAARKQLPSLSHDCDILGP